MSALLSSGSRPTRVTWVFYALSLSGTAFLVAAVFFAPWLASSGSSLAAPLYRLFSHVCHQIPSRCFQIFGHPMPVCGRCLGVYLGLFFGCVIYPLWRRMDNIRLPDRRTFAALSLPLAADVLGNAFGFWDSGIWLRLATGFLWGALLPFYFLAAAAELALRRLAITRGSK